MGKISIDLSSLKAAGIYTLEVDNSQRSSETTEALRLIVGFSNKGPFNRPVLLEQDIDRTTIFGDIDTKLEHKGCFFNRMLRTLLTDGPVIALNLLKVDDSYNGKDQINYAAMSLDAATPNPSVGLKLDKYGEYDYLAETLDNTLYGTVKGDVIPYVGTTPFASVYNRSRFWTPDKDLLMAAAARGLQTSDAKNDRATFEYSNLLNFANVGTDEFSLLVFKPSNVAGYDVTVESWYGGKENIPFGWMRPYDYISDYFVQVVCIKGNWTNYPVLATDPVWGGYFDKRGILKDKVNSFMGADGITVLGSWSGVVIPDFVDKQGTNLSIERKINAATEKTGLLMTFNNDAANVLTYDYSGKDADPDDPDQGCWGIDIDGNNEIAGSEGTAEYIVDMCGHGAFMSKTNDEAEWKAIDASTVAIAKDSSVVGTRTARKSLAKANMVRLTAFDSSVLLKVTTPAGTIENISTGIFLDSSMMYDEADSSIMSENNIKSLINPNYYVIADSGLIQNSTITPELVSVDYDEDDVAPNATVAVKTIVYYEDVQTRYQFNIDLDQYENIAFIGALTIEIATKKETNIVNGINFLSYNYVSNDNDGVIASISSAHYLSEVGLWADETPVNADVKNLIIITDADEWIDDNVKVGDFLRNITFNNEVGETQKYQLIPGLTRVIKKQFLAVTKDGGKKYIKYNKNLYEYVGKTDTAANSTEGVYLLTCTAPVLIEDEVITRQLAMSDDAISHSLRFIPLKGLALSSRHRPGYDEEGNLDIEGGIEKIYGVLEEDGIHRGMINKSMVDYRYIIDSMSYGLRAELGGKVYLSEIAADRGKCTAVLNLPSAKQFAVSSNPYFCDSYIPGQQTRPSMNTKYIPEGGNTEMGSTAVFSLPGSTSDIANHTACFWPNLIYTENGKTISVPPAADVANVLNRKFTGVNDPYCICANQNGILSNKYLTGLEFLADRTDREYLEPFGVNTIIKDGNNIMIYGNQTAYQKIKSDFNKLHVRENLNTVEIECEAVLKKYNFLYNNAATRANIVAQLTPILQVMQVSGALAKYEIVCDETNNTSDVIEADTCLVDVGLWFNHGMEKIVQQFTVNRYASLDDD